MLTEPQPALAQPLPQGAIPAGSLQWRRKDNGILEFRQAESASLTCRVRFPESSSFSPSRGFGAPQKRRSHAQHRERHIRMQDDQPEGDNARIQHDHKAHGEQVTRPRHKENGGRHRSRSRRVCARKTRGRKGRKALSKLDQFLSARGVSQRDAAVCKARDIYAESTEDACRRHSIKPSNVHRIVSIVNAIIVKDGRLLLA